MKPRFTNPAPKISDDAVKKAYELWGTSEAARRLGMTANAVDNRMRRIKKRGMTRSEYEKREAEKANEAAVEFRKYLEEQQRALLENAGTRTNPHKFRDGNSIQELLANHAVKPENVTIGTVKIGEHGVVTKNTKTGKAEAHVIYSKSATLKPRTVECPFILPAALPPKITHAPAPRILRKVRTLVVLSDMQTGGLRDPQTLKIIPTHDPKALEVARRIIADVGPKKCIGIGDRMDWPSFSRYTKHPEYFATTNWAIQQAVEWEQRFIAAAPKGCRFIEIDSNHRVRLEKFALEHNMELMHLKKGKLSKEEADSWGVLTEPYLLRYKELGIELVAPYPGGIYYDKDIPGLGFTHVPPKSGEVVCDIIHGHEHKVRGTPHVFHGPQTMFTGGRMACVVYDAGCLCRVDMNPNTQSIHTSVVPAYTGRNNWHQGIIVVEYITGKTPVHHIQQVRINNGTALFGGQMYRV